MSQTEDEYSLETPVDDVNSTVYPTAVRKPERAQRRISFGDISKEFPSPLPQNSDATSSRTTPQKSLQVEVDSPYTPVTPEKLAEILATDRRAPPIDHKFHGSTKGCDFDLLPLFICGLLQLSMLANSLSKWNKGNSSIPHLIESLMEKRPTIIETIVEVTKHTGVTAQSFMIKARQLLQSQESDTHSSIVMCVMMYVWATHPDSQKREIALLAIQDYALAEDTEVDPLIAASEEGKTINLHTSWEPLDLRGLPGCKRLDWNMNLNTFTAHWGDAFLLMANRLSYEVPSKTNIGSLENALMKFPIDSQNRSNHPFVINGTTVAEKNAAIVAAQRSLVQQCKAAGIPERAPTQELCKEQLILCLPDPTYVGLKTIISHEDLNPQTYSEVLTIAIRAEKRHSHQLPIITRCDAIRKAAKTSENQHDDRKQPKSEKAPSDKPAKPEKIDKRDKQLTDEEFATKLKSLVAIYTSQPALAKRTQSAFGPHMYYEHPPEVSALRSLLYSKLREKNMCSCCGDADPLFPDHDWKECPYMPYNKQVIPRVDKPPVSPLSVKKLTSFPVAFNASYTGRTSPVHPGSSLHTIFSYSSCLNPAEPLSAPGDVATSPHLPSTWLTHWYRCGLTIITLLLAWLMYPCVVPSSSSPEHVRPMMPHFNAHPAAITAKAHTHEIFLAFDEHDTPLRVGTDSYSEGSLISSAKIGPHLTIHPSPISMTGVGGESFSPGYVVLPLRFQWGAVTDTINAYVVDPGVLPQHVDLLLGLDSQSTFDITIDTYAVSQHFCSISKSGNSDRKPCDSVSSPVCGSYHCRSN